MKPQPSINVKQARVQSATQNPAL